MLQIKRIYDPAKASDGFRVLVDRLWPRGLSKNKAHVDLWLKAIAPSDSLRQWFGHDPARWSEFQKRYRRELRDNPEPLQELKRLLKEHDQVTLLFGARDVQHNQAVMLQSYLQRDR